MLYCCKSELKPDILKLRSDVECLFKHYLSEFGSVAGSIQFKSSFPYLYERHLEVDHYIKNQKLLYNKYPEEYGITELMRCASCTDEVMGKWGAECDLETSIAKALKALKNGADINVKDIYGRTALFYPAIADQFIEGAHKMANIYESFVKLLLENGADPTIKDRDGKTALGYYQIYARSDSSVFTLLKDGMEKSNRNQQSERTSIKLFDGSRYIPKQNDDSLKQMPKI